MKKENKLNIAEYVFAKQTDTVIVSEIVNCARSLFDEDIINLKQFEHLNNMMFNEPKMPKEAMLIIDNYLTKIDNKTGEELMQEYYSGKL